MKNLLHLFLKYTWTIREYTDKKGNLYWIFNFYNPIGWVMLLAWALVLGIAEGVLAFGRIVTETIKDSLNP